MQLYKVLTILLMSLCAANGLRCYVCLPNEPTPCTRILTCPDILNRCFTLSLNGEVTKGCQNSELCMSPVDCCEGNLCNSAIPTGPSVVLLLVSSAIVTLFL